jgi:hypothetical protein
MFISLRDIGNSGFVDRSCGLEIGVAYRERCRWCYPRLRTSLASRQRRRCRLRYSIGPLDGKSALWNERIGLSIGAVC